MSKRYLIAVMAVSAVVIAACDGESEETTTNTAEAEATTSAGEAEGPPTSPSSLTADAQESDGTTIVIASVSLPAPGFVAVHGDDEGSPGPVVDHSDLLPAGESTDVTVTLEEPLTESGTLGPMVHIDINDNGEYEFFPPDETIVAVISVEMTVG